MIKKVLGILVLAACFPGLTFCTTTRYWISFNEANKTPLFLMQIDALGNVLIPPKAVVHGTHRGVSGVTLPTAIANGVSNNINLWFVSGENFTEVFRASIGKNTLALRSLKRVNITPVEEQQAQIQVTQRAENNFLAVKIGDATAPTLQGFGLASSGSLDGQNWQLTAMTLGVFPNGDSCDNFCGESVSSDGKYAVFVVRKGSANILYIQALGPVGKPVRPAQRIDVLHNLIGGITSYDMSGILSAGTRLLVYNWSPEFLSAPQFLARELGASDKLFVQVIDNKTGNKIGQKISLPNPSAGDIFIIVIDPAGRFVIYSAGALYFQALDATGHPSGPLKIIHTARGLLGLDILQDSLN